MDDYYVNVDRFRSLVERTFGLCLSDPTDQIQNVVRRRILATGCRDFASYEALVTGQSSSLSMRPSKPLERATRASDSRS